MTLTPDEIKQISDAVKGGNGGGTPMPNRVGMVKGFAEGFKLFLVAAVIGGVLVATGSITILTGLEWGAVGFAIGFAEGWLD